MTSKNYIIAAVAAIVFIALMLFAVFANFELNPYKKGTWEASPIVVNCPTSNFTLDEVGDVVDEWRDRGHFFLDVQSWDQCPLHNEFGYIFVRGPGLYLTDDRVGNARVSKIKGTSQIIGAMIETVSNNKLILSHEVGHSLGYEHVSIEGHLMYHDYKFIGTNDEGLHI